MNTRQTKKWQHRIGTFFIRAPFFVDATTCTIRHNACDYSILGRMAYETIMEAAKTHANGFRQKFLVRSKVGECDIEEDKDAPSCWASFYSQLTIRFVNCVLLWCKRMHCSEQKRIMHGCHTEKTTSESNKFHTSNAMCMSLLLLPCSFRLFGSTFVQSDIWSGEK